MSLIGKEILLQGKTRKGKNRISQFGNIWTVMAETDRVIFSQEQGPWLFITVSSSGKDMNHASSRWIKKTDDPDFSFQTL